MFDSHSKDQYGKSCPDGLSVLLKFSNRKSLECHVIKNYLNESDVNIPFEIQFLQIKNSDNGPDLKALYQLENDRRRKRMDFEKEKCRKRKSTDIEKEKTCKRIRKLKKNKQHKNCIQAFKTAICEGPYFICEVCNR